MSPDREGGNTNTNTKTAREDPDNGQEAVHVRPPPCEALPLFSYLKFEVKGPIARVTLDNPKKLNVFSVPMLEELEMAFDQIIEDESIKCVIFASSSKKAFSAGADIQEMSTRDVLGGIRFSDRGHRIARKMELCMPPVIIALRGMVLGGALEFASACDIRVATPDTSFSQPEINIGIIPGWGGTQRLMKLIGVGKAKEMIYTGSRVDAHKALELGLVNAVVEDSKLEETVDSLAEMIASKSRPVLMAAKQAIHVGLDSSLDIGLRFEIQKWGTLFDTFDRREGMRAFLEKRSPKFQDR